MSAEGFRQEMPPKGGYEGITWERIPMKKPLSGLKIFTAYIVISTFSFWCYGLSIRQRRKTRRENEDLTVALEPLLMAERDRIYLNQLRSNREEETELMKNVPGWKVGTLYGDPLYKTIGDNIMDPTSLEYYAHTDLKHRTYMHMYNFWM